MTSPCPHHPNRFAAACPPCWGAITTTEAAICAAARQAVGWPFRHAGRNDRGIDCVGLLMHVADRIGWEHDHFRSYPSGIAGDAVRDELARRMDPVGLDCLRPGNAILVRLRRLPCHVMILTERAGLIHAKARDRVVEHGIDERWLGRVVSAYRFREVPHG